MKRLNQVTLAQVPPSISRPQYDRAATGVGIVHLGVGAFHRAHQAFYTEAVLNNKGGDWGIIGASLRSTHVSQQLNPQDGLYTLVEKNNGQQTEQIIGAIKSIIAASETPGALIELLADDKTKIISLTITEKGYLYNPATKSLNFENPDIQHDIKNFPDAPVTAIGYIIAGLARRMREKRSGVTLLSCDNLPNNGKILLRVIGDCADAVDSKLLTWIKHNVSCPNTMIDRIVPASTAKDLEALANKLGLEDQAAVFTEPFSQWVIEDDFINGRPEWESAGALLVDDVKPFEDAKLRLLNGSHSLMAYLGYLAGYDFVHQVVADGDFHQLVRSYMAEVIPGLEVPIDFNLSHYTQQLMERFSNSSLNHKTAQIAQDGSQKIPQRWFNSIANPRCTTLNCHALALAGWVHFIGGKRDNGETYTIDDPMAEALKNKVNHSQELKIENALQVIGLGDVIGKYPSFLALANNYLFSIQSHGVKATVKELADQLSAV
jgi:fructuronate reductase